MEAWDDDNFEPPVAPAPTVAVVPNKWEGEDEEDEVKESWEDEDEAQEEKKKEENSKLETDAKKPKKKSLAERIAEKERQKREELEKRLKEQEEEDISPEERLRRQQESDLSLALETTFAAKNENCTIGDLTMPETKEEFEAFADSLTKKLSPLTKSPEYIAFVEILTRNLCASMSSFDIKKIKNSVDNLYLEKQKIEKGDKAKKSKAKSKAKIRVEGDSCVSDEMRDLMDNLHKTCVANTGVDEARIVDANKGHFEDDEKLKCYMRCVLDEVGLFEDDVFDLEGCIAMLPDEVRDTKLSDVMRACGASSTGSCQSMFDLNKCVYKGAPDLYFLP